MRRPLTTLLVLALGCPCYAHDGPPYPIAVDTPFGPETLSIWADPDVGTGTFYLYLPEETEAEALREHSISLWVRPLDGHQAEQEFIAERADPSQPYQRIVRAEFDVRGAWRARFTIDADSGVLEHTVDVDVTASTFGPIDLLWFAFPFLLIGFLWLKVMLQRRAYSRSIQLS